MMEVKGEVSLDLHVEGQRYVELQWRTKPYRHLQAQNRSTKVAKGKYFLFVEGKQEKRQKIGSEKLEDIRYKC